jgi:AcrR family transcriptional regulator
MSVFTISGKETSKSKEGVLLVAAAKMFSQKGYSATSIKDITSEAGLSVGSFYSYFENKEAIVDKLYDSMTKLSFAMASSAAKGAPEGIAEQFTYALTSAISVYVDNRELAQIILLKCMGINDHLERRRRETFDRTTKFLERVLAHLVQDHDVVIDDEEVIAIAITHSVFGLVVHLIEGRNNDNLIDIVYPFCVYHLRGLRIKFSEGKVRQVIAQALEIERRNKHAN